MEEQYALLWIEKSVTGAQEGVDVNNYERVFDYNTTTINGHLHYPSEGDEFDEMGVNIERGLGFDECWEFDFGPFLEHALMYMAFKCGDHDALSLACYICSLGATLRPNFPEEWW